MSFATPSAPSGGVSWEDHLGALLIIEPLSFEQQVQTVHGLSDAVTANVYVIEGPGAGESYSETMLWPKILVSQTKTHLGEKILGRLGQGNKKPGQNAPWIFNEASAEDITKAEQWVAENAKSTVTSAQAPF